MAWVYPRPRGGARERQLGARDQGGLSPPTRGSLARIVPTQIDRGSIPAHAGEPGPPLQILSHDMVYPRPRGGAPADPVTLPVAEGLSPPTRGSHHEAEHGPAPRRSIPAHAGEPSRRRTGTRCITVYPRPRGGAMKKRQPRPLTAGLSPPTRGSLPQVVALRMYEGSIPAHAGEPHALLWSRLVDPVYPRPRGGARTTSRTTSRTTGLSPPTRGEPSATSFPTSGGTVYPRPRGGAGFSDDEP